MPAASSFYRLGTIGAKPEQFKVVPAGCKAESPVDVVLRALDGRVDELHYLAASDAGKVVVVLVAIGMLILPRAVVVAGFAGKPGVGKELDGAKYGSLADSRIQSTGGFVQGLGAYMRLKREECLEHGFPCNRHLESSIPEIALEDGSLFARRGRPALFFIYRVHRCFKGTILHFKTGFNLGIKPAENLSMRYIMTIDRIKALIFTLFAGVLSLANAFAGVEFIGPDIAPDDTLLFSARVDIPGDGGYDTLFAAKAETGELTQLTFYPEAIAIVDDGRRLQIRNRFGIFMTDRGFANLQPLPTIPAFVRGSSIQQGKLIDSRPSPDGTMLLYLSPTSSSRGDLILFDLAKNTEAMVAKGIEFSVNSFPARWSLDSRYFVYSRKEELYYFSTDQLRSGRIPEESWRKVGSGRIEQSRWSANGSLYVLRDRSLYRIMPEEFFTQAIYSGIVQPGSMVGKAPFPYDPNFDSFWISPDGGKVMLCKDGRNIFLYRLDPDDFGRDDAVNAMPYLFLQGNTIISDVLWPSNDQVTIFTGSLKNGSRVSGAFRISVPVAGKEGLSANFTALDVQGALSLALSPDETRIALTTSEGISIRRYANWAEEKKIAAPGAKHALWISTDGLVVAGSTTIELVYLGTSERKLVGLAQAGKYGWTESGKAAAQNGSLSWEMALPSNASPGTPWEKTAAYNAKAVSTSSGGYRVYLDALSSGSYQNMVMVRATKGLGTRSLIPAPSKKYKPFPMKDDTRTSVVFDFGSRIRRREASLVINAYDGAEGLVNVLEALRAYGVKATFFLNGEFIRRNPGASKLIAESGNEVGNMFFSTFDPTDSRYRVDKEFIQRGLARTEDEYFTATGRELSLLWHTPYYSSNSLILESAAAMNYNYIGRDMDPLDWVGKFSGAITQGLYARAHDIVDRITAAAKPGSIIPIRLGIPEGGRDTYLFNELPLLLNALINEGFDLVPVSALMDHAN